MTKTLPVLDRVLRRVEKPSTDGCWIWTGKVSTGGYGQVRIGGRGSGMAYVHRVVYELLVGPIPQGMKIDHTCHSRAVIRGSCPGGVRCTHRACVNPEHLESVTQRENLLRGNTGPGLNAAKTHCVKGHPFSGPNLIQRKSGVRDCRTCVNARRRKSGRPTVWPGDSDSLLRNPVRA